MEILFVASEVAPWSKTGGLGDVAGSLPRALAARGHAVSVVSPRYGSIDAAARGFTRLDAALRVRGEPTSLWVKKGRPDVYLVEHERWFGSRRGLYGDGTRDWPDNAERFTYLARAALALPGAMGLRPRVVHANDWQTGLVPFLLRHEHSDDPALAAARSVFTVHNLAYQGSFPKQVMPFLGLPWDAFRLDALEFHDQLSFMKAGLSFADALTTVSPTYAREILTPEGGHGLDPVLRHRRADLHGILNGIDVAEWDPARDPHLPARYAARDLAGKALDEIEFKRMLSGENDGNGAIVQITSGAGGVDASDWAQMLERMLIRYAERKGWKVEIVEETPAEEAGIKGATFMVTGDYAYGLLKAENGVHRLVRVSPFDANARRQTSFDRTMRGIPISFRTFSSVSLPRNSAIISWISAPLAMKCPCPRW